MSRRSVCTEPGCPTLVDGKGRCAIHGKPDLRPSASAQGYGSAWRRTRDAFIATHPVCQGDGAGAHHPGCDGRSKVADHDPLTRRELLARGDPNPDDWSHLVGRSHLCHGRKSALFDGAFGNRPKPRPGGDGILGGSSSGELVRPSGGLRAKSRRR